MMTVACCVPTYILLLMVCSQHMVDVVDNDFGMMIERKIQGNSNEA